LKPAGLSSAAAYGYRAVLETQETNMSLSTLSTNEREATQDRPRWTRGDVAALLALPFPDLMYRAQTIHRVHFNPSEVQISTLLSIKTGGCPEDCGYCPQAAAYETGTPAAKLMAVDAVVAEARAAREKGATRFCDRRRTMIWRMCAR
jgi:biotin synthase